MLGEKQKRWIEILRSGQYKQGRSYLCREHNGIYEYCCLGVGCEIFSAPKNIDRRDDYTIIIYAGDTQISNYLVPELKLNCKNGSASGSELDMANLRKFLKEKFYHNSIYLTELNDSGLTFNDIAEIVETFPQLFFTEPV